MHEMAASVWQEQAQSDDTNHIELRLHDLPPAKADSVTIKQVWTNLISNARKYSLHKPDATVEIGYEHRGEDIAYYVRDNGAGFDMQYYDKLFGVFQRLHSQEEFEGTGVGLAIVQRIISKHGGQIWAKSEVDKGATFYFTVTGGE
jgi:light-regulated signal transduction histidine kinase (bacteriophytochrome)